MNTVFSDILTNEEVVLLEDLVKSEVSRRQVVPLERDENGKLIEINSSDFVRHEEDNGRVQLELFPLPQNIIEKFHDLINTKYDRHNFIGAVYCEYNKKYGKPTLNEHYDSPTTDNLCFDYQLESNISWPLIINSQDFILENNSAVTMRPSIQLHSRKKIDFNDGDFVKMFFTFWKKNEDK